MAATDLQALRFRAVFAEREPSRGVDLSDVESVFTQLDALFKVAWAIGDPETLRLEAEFRARFPRGSGGEPLLQRRFAPEPPAPLPSLRSLVLRSPLELLADMPAAFVLGGGAVAALSVLIERVLNFPLRLHVQREKLRAQQAAWEAARTRSELLVVAQQADALRALESGNLEIRSLELVDPDDDAHRREAEN
jgi:hypothetical protein